MRRWQGRQAGRQITLPTLGGSYLSTPHFAGVHPSVATPQCAACSPAADTHTLGMGSPAVGHCRLLLLRCHLLAGAGRHRGIGRGVVGKARRSSQGC